MSFFAGAAMATNDGTSRFIGSKHVQFSLPFLYCTVGANSIVVLTLPRGSFPPPEVVASPFPPIIRAGVRTCDVCMKSFRTFNKLVEHVTSPHLEINMVGYPTQAPL